MNVGTVTVELKLLSAQFVKGLAAAISPLKALQQQANAVASSFRFIGGALATGGIAGLVTNLADAEDAFLGMKAAMSGSIRDASELSKNYQGLQKVTRALALETGYAVTEIADTATNFLRANVPIRQTAESLKAVIDLAKAEGDSLEDISTIAIDITKAFKLTGKEFNHVADILVNASLASNVSIRQLGESFKYVSGVAVEFDQTAESTAALLAVLGDEGQRASLAGTALRQIFISLQKDFEKQNSTLKRFGISLFQGGEMAERFDSKFRPLPEILLELGKKAGTAGNFINIFQARALTAALGIADESSEVFTELVSKIGETGSAARLAAIRSESLSTMFGQLKASVNEFVISLGLQGGLIAELKNAVTGVKNFFVGLSQLDPRLLQLGTRILVTGAQVGIMIAGFVALSGAAAALLSPLGMAATALFTFTEAGKKVSLFEEYSKEIGQLSNLFSEFASFIGNEIGFRIAFAISKGVRVISESLGKLELPAGLQEIAVGFSKMFYELSESIFVASVEMGNAASQSQEFVTNALSAMQVTGGLAVNMDQLATSEQKAAAVTQAFSQQIGEAQGVLNDIRGEMTKLVSESAPASQKIQGIIDSLGNSTEAAGTLVLLRGLLGEAKALEAQLKLAGGKNPGELLAAGMEIADEQTRKLRESLGGFDAETGLMVEELQRLQAASAALGQENAKVFDDLIAKVKEVRAEQQGLFTVEFGRGIQDGVGQMVSGLLHGTREAVSAGELLRGALLAEFESLFRQIILRKLVFDKVFKDNFAGLGKFVQDVFGSIFGGGGASGAGGAIVTAGKTILSALGVPSFAEGAIAGGPMLAMVGDAGPSGRGKEAIMPLDKLRDFGMGGGGTTVNLYTDQPSDRVNVREIGGGGLDRVVEITVGAVEKNILQRGSIHRAHLATTTARTRTSR